MNQNGVESWLNVEDYDYGATFDIEDFRGAVCLGGVDLAETTDLCCAKALCMKSDKKIKYILTRYFIPQSKLDPENDDHNAGAKYKEWAQQGYIEVCEGNDIDLTIVADWFASLRKKYGIKLIHCGYDQRFAKDFLRRMEEYGWSKEAPYKELEMVVQDSKTLSNAINLVEADFKGRLINYGDNPVDKWCLSNSCLKLNDLRQALIVKTARENKIDGAVTLAIVYEMYRRYRSELANMVKGGNE